MCFNTLPESTNINRIASPDIFIQITEWHIDYWAKQYKFHREFVKEACVRRIIKWWRYIFVVVVAIEGTFLFLWPTWLTRYPFQLALTGCLHWSFSHLLCTFSTTSYLDTTNELELGEAKKKNGNVKTERGQKQGGGKEEL
jgi:hypothetical protein